MATMAGVVHAVQAEMDQLSRASDELGAISRRMVDSSARAGSQVHSLTSSAGHVTGNAQTVAIRQIAEIITQIDDTQTGIASAVEEQRATTQEIGRSATDTATAAESISNGVESVSEATDATRADAVERSATVLADVTGTLRQALGRIRV